jgi:hypothetical protein
MKNASNTFNADYDIQLSTNTLQSLGLKIQLLYNIWRNYMPWHALLKK